VLEERVLIIMDVLRLYDFTFKSPLKFKNFSVMLLRQRKSEKKKNKKWFVVQIRHNLLLVVMKFSNMIVQ